MHTVEKRKVYLKGDSKIIFKDPVVRSGILLKVYPVINLAKVGRKKYFIHIYLNAIKLFSEQKSKNVIKIGKNTKKVIFSYGINSKEVYLYNDKISSIRDERYYLLNNAMAYIVSQILYENIENQPFLVNLSSKEESLIKQVKYYISKSYIDTRFFIIDYILCKKDKIERKIIENTDVNSLKELEEKIRKSL